MAWESEIYSQNRLWDEFQFFAYGSTAMTETIDISRAYKLGVVRLHLSTAFASIEDLVIRLSSITGSRYNITFLSQAMNGLKDLIWTAGSAEMPFLSGDQIIITMSTAASINNWGLTAIGWAVQCR